jgi:hypothetical protein
MTDPAALLAHIDAVLDPDAPPVADIGHVLDALAGDSGDMCIGRWIPEWAAEQATIRPSTVTEFLATRDTLAWSSMNYDLEAARGPDRLNAIWDAVYGPAADPDSHDVYALFRQMLTAATEQTRADRPHGETELREPGERSTDTLAAEQFDTHLAGSSLNSPAARYITGGMRPPHTETINRAAGASVYEAAPPVTYEDIAQAMNATWRDTCWLEAPDLIDYDPATARRRLIDGIANA